MIDLLNDQLHMIAEPCDSTLPEAVLYLENAEGDRYLFQFYDWFDVSTPIYQGVKLDQPL